VVRFRNEDDDDAHNASAKMS